MPTTLDLFKKHQNKYFVESGSYLGDGIQAAIDCGFENIISLEISKQYEFICKNRFYLHADKVKIINGDSSEILYDEISSIDEPITFWLDGHYSGGPTGLGKHEYPLIQELEQIKKHHIKTHTILIDDLRIVRGNEETATGEPIAFCEDDLIEAILKINKEYNISYEDGITHAGISLKNDILVATL
ncbi:hypothetical protein CL622_01505 [archaeon]|nr:hypothetical protein [archaeon]